MKKREKGRGKETGKRGRYSNITKIEEHSSFVYIVKDDKRGENKLGGEHKGDQKELQKGQG